MFLSPVDRVKYPNVEQEFRFEFVSREQKTVSEPVNVEEIEAPVLENSTLIMDFLDKETTNEKMQFLLQNKDYMSDAFLSVAAQSLDFTESKATLEERFDDIMRYLRTVSKYENTRFR
jgi:hypothetical protein